jgi:hypothetical protein
VVPMTQEEFHAIRLKVYSKYILTYENELEVVKFVKQFNICEAVAIHVRKTDFGEYEGSDDQFYDFIDSFDETVKVLILTDNGITQKEYMNRIGLNRSIIYHRIPLDRPYSRMRHTSLVIAAREMMIATFAREFMGTPESTFSETIGI